MPRPPSRFRASLVVSVALHAALVAMIGQIRLPPPEPPPPRMLELELRSHGPRPADVSGDPAPPDEVPPEPTPPKVQPQPPKPPQPAPAPPPAPEGAVAPAPRAPEPPKTFAEYRQQRFARFEGSLRELSKVSPGGGAPDARDTTTNPGRDRCEPPETRRPQVVYLLFDSSGSMDSIQRREALTCARQYAKASLESGALVVVGNFAGTSTFAPPTRDLTDIEFALRSGTNPRATLIPSRELDRFVDANPRVLADLVIVSDGYISNYRDALNWYRYFLELNPDNRGLMFTIRTPGPREVVDAFQDIGFEVHIYRML